jgi:ribose transport system permease protein
VPEREQSSTHLSEERGKSAVPTRRRSLLAQIARRGGLTWAQQNGVFFGLVGMIILFSLLNLRFFTWSNATTILLQVAVIGVVAVPGGMLILSGYVDLSVGSVAVLASIVFGQAVHGGVPIGAAAIIGLAVGAAWGTLNAVLIALLDFSPIVVTLGGLAAARSIAEVISQGETQFGFGHTFDQLGNGTILGLGVPVWLFILIALIGAFLWNQTPLGRHMTAIGADRDAARAVGINTKRIPFWLYIASGLAAALSGLIVTAQLDGASLSIGQDMELSVLTAILLGGVSFVGGRGTLFGVITGLLFLGVLTNGLIVLDVNEFWQGVATGAALVIAAGLDVLYRRIERIPVPEEALPEPAVEVDASVALPSAP